MFKCNRELCDLIDLLSAVENEAEQLGRLIGNAETEILACDGFWTFKIKYGEEKKMSFYRDFETIEDMRKEISVMTIAAKISRWEEV